MELRRFGRMNVNVSIITLGGFGIGRLSQDEADKAIALALKHGVNIIDVAPSYYDAELRLRPILRKQRNHFFICEKTRERTKEEAWKELNFSLKQLEIKKIDLYQFHAISNLLDIKKSLKKMMQYMHLKKLRT